MTEAQLDDLDRRIVVALQRDGRASITTLARICGTTEATARRRVGQLLDGRMIQVAVVPNERSHGPTEHFQIRLHCRAGRQIEVIEQLVARRDVRFLALTTGPFDLMVEVMIRRSEDQFARVALDLQEIDGIAGSESNMILREYKVSQDWSQQLLEGDAGQLPDDLNAECSPDHFDDVDWQIVELLRSNGRMGFTEMAAKLSINESTARRRFDRMRTNGCIAVVTQTRAVVLGLESEVLLHLDLAPSRVDAVATELVQHRSVRYVGANLGSSSLLCEVIADSSEELNTFLTKTVARLKGVNSWQAAMELLTIKRGYVEVPWWRSELNLDAVS